MKLNLTLDKRKLVIPISIIGVTAILFCCSFFVQSESHKTAYVDIGRLYEEFTMKQELEQQLTAVQSSRKNITDSLGLELNVLENKLNSSATIDSSLYNIYKGKRQDYLYRAQSFEQDNQALTDQYTAQIWKQLNQYITDYGKENSYDFILGGDGSGSLMYAREGLNITNELSVYVNKRYNGGK